MSGDDSQNPSLQDRTQAFLREFFTKGEELVRELIDENERLRQGGSLEGAPAATAELVNRLKAQVEELEAECEEIRRLAGLVQTTSGSYRGRLDALEQEHYHLAAMYVTGGQLQRASTVEEVLRTTTEVLLNFIGVGRFTLFAVDERASALFPLHREGALEGEGTPKEIPLPGAGAMAEATSLGHPWRAGSPMKAGDGGLMHLPLVSGTRLVGVIRIESFLPQKAAFGENDFGLLELVSEQSGIAIENAWIRAHAESVPLSRVELEELVPA